MSIITIDGIRFKENSLVSRIYIEMKDAEKPMSIKKLASIIIEIYVEYKEIGETKLQSRISGVFASELGKTLYKRVDKGVYAFVNPILADRTQLHRVQDM